MANLLPPDARTNVLYEYWTRVAVVALLTLSAVALTLAVLLLPAYVLINKQEQALTTRIDSMRAQHDAYRDAAAAIESANTLARYIDRHDSAASFRELMRTIDDIAGNDITVTAYSFAQSDAGAVAPIKVSGVASTRTALASFRDTLRADERFANVELPIASLAADRDVPFSLTITLATP
jgi:hypothetical protein